MSTIGPVFASPFTLALARSGRVAKDSHQPLPYSYRLMTPDGFSGVLRPVQKRRPRDTALPVRPRCGRGRRARLYVCTVVPVQSRTGVAKDSGPRGCIRGQRTAASSTGGPATQVTAGASWVHRGPAVARSTTQPSTHPSTGTTCSWRRQVFCLLSSSSLLLDLIPLHPIPSPPPPPLLLIFSGHAPAP